MKAITFLLATLLIVSQCAHAQITFQNSSITASTLMASSFISDNEGWLADNNDKLWHTANAGLTWDSTSIENTFLKLDFIDALNGFALSSSAAYKTTDGGHTWSQPSLPGGIGKGLYFFDIQTGFISSYKQVYKTTDGGITWTTISTDETSFVDFYFVNSSTGIAAANDDESSKSIWRTTDGGLTWSNVYNRPKYIVNSICFTNENIGFAVGCYDQIGEGCEPEILETTDGGLTWKEVYRNPEIIRPGESLIDIRFGNSQEGVAISNYSESVYTIDGGSTWYRFYEDETVGLPSLQPLYKTIGGHSDLYIAGQLGYVVKWK